jgi:hypothetical protein
MARTKKGKRKASQPGATVDKARRFQPWLDYYREFPLMMLPLLLTLLGGAWVLSNAYRPWVQVDATICSRTVNRWVESDEDSYSEHFPATFAYLYVYEGRHLTSSFEDDKIADSSKSTRSYSEAVTEAKRREIGDTYPIYVDSANPETATAKRPRVALPLFGVVSAAVMLLYLGSTGRRQDEGPSCLAAVMIVPLLLSLWSQQIPPSQEISPDNSVLPYLQLARQYPSLGYVPQNQIRQFDSVEALMKSWGRPDDLWIDDVDKGHRLTLTYRHGADWAQAWSADFQLTPGQDPIALGPPRKDDPKR